MAYATSADYAAFTGKAASADTERLLERASEAIDAAIVIAFDAEDHTDALMRAACAIVEAWVGTNAITPDKADFPAAGQDVSLGELSLSSGGGGSEGGSSVAAMPERARRILAADGLLYRGVPAY